MLFSLIGSWLYSTKACWPWVLVTKKKKFYNDVTCGLDYKHITIVNNGSCTMNLFGKMTVNDASRIVIDDSKVMLYIEASLLRSS